MKYLFIILSLLVIKPYIVKYSSPQRVDVYSGNCTCYKKTLVETNKVKYTPIGKGFGKVVINRTAKTFNFFYDSKLIVSAKNYDSYLDGNEGGEGFTFDSSSDAHRFTAERLFRINTGMVFGGSLGYEYEISNCIVN